MTEQELIFFTTIVSTGSYSEAAFGLNISQSAISKRIQSLENELGVQLFDRSHRSATLTEAGRQLLPEAVAILEEIKHMRATAQLYNGENQNRIRVLTLPFIGQFHFYTPIHHFEMEYPDYTVDLIEKEEPQLFHLVDRQDFDLAIVYRDPFYWSENWYFHKILEDEVVLAVPEGHLLTEYADGSQPADAISPAAIEAYKVMGMEQFTTVNHACEAYFVRHGVHLNITSRARPESILGACEAGRGIALVTRLQARFFDIHHVHMLSFDPPIPSTLGIIVRGDHVNDPVYQKFVHQITRDTTEQEAGRVPS
jgi:DNA-binding transcriptional LysR family regulator